MLTISMFEILWNVLFYFVKYVTYLKVLKMINNSHNSGIYCMLNNLFLYSLSYLFILSCFWISYYIQILNNNIRFSKIIYMQYKTHNISWIFLIAWYVLSHIYNTFVLFYIYTMQYTLWIYFFRWYSKSLHIIHVYSK